MNAPQSINKVLTAFQEQAINNACSNVAPSWPLDQNIAVNPFWNMRNESFENVSVKLSALGKINTLMPVSYYMAQFQNGTITEDHLKLAAQSLGLKYMNKNVLSVINKQSNLSHWHNVSDLLDSERKNKVAWRDEITHQISQFCAAYFQYDGPLKPIHDTHQAGFYQTWLNIIQRDKGIAILMGEPKLNQYFLNLPNDQDGLFAQAIDELGIDDDTIELYLQSLLLEVNGWASWVAFQNFHQENHKKDATLFNFLAIRLAWELVLWRYYNDQSTEDSRRLSYQWTQEKVQLPRVIDQHKEVQESLWVWQKAMEIAYQSSVVKGLQATLQHDVVQHDIKVQAVFCIDVRSEVMRRAFESQSPSIQTFGFAGFFGMPISYSQQGSDATRPQLPGLIQAPFNAEEEAYNIDVKQAENAKAFNRTARLQNWSQQPSATFSMVEASGLFYGYKLLKNTLFSKKKEKDKGEFQSSPYWSLKQGHRPVTLAQKCTLIANALKGIGLTQAFAPKVLMVGHESQGVNNPHQHSLNCGACGGQSGELNVRIFCQLANDESIRAALKKDGINIPDSTVFLPVVHNTTTDDMRVVSDASIEDELLSWLDNAQQITQKERATNLGLSANDAELSAKIRARSQDWSQVRPEWGLANNASFIIAPRSLTAGLNLEGRAFLHDYNASQDENFNVLSSIMTAPMIVTNWINMQYNASVMDNAKYGSGNKVLHNVVGGNIGVFEGNGGDLRIGLSKQSIHNGEKWMHQPLRLSVFIAAPCNEIEKIINANESIQSLVNNNWLFILQLDTQTMDVKQYTNQTWQPFLIAEGGEV
ncbi:YbcC family protein [Pseudomonas sp. HK3]